MPTQTRLRNSKFMLLGREQPCGKPVTKFGKATCGARTRKGTHCRCLALANGRCKLHGGLSTGPKTAEGWARVRAAHAAYWAARKAAQVVRPCSVTVPSGERIPRV